MWFSMAHVQASRNPKLLQYDVGIVDFDRVSMLVHCRPA